MFYKVTASITLHYDTEDGLVQDSESAREDMLDGLIDGIFSPGEFMIEVEELDTDY